MRMVYGLLFVFFWHAPSIWAQEKREIDDKSFRDVANELRCPTCTGLSVLESDAKFSVQIKDEVRKQMEAGQPKEKILEFFSQRYGPWILRKPPTEGVNALVWWVPVLLLIFGPILVWFFLWRKKKVISSQGIRSTQDIVAQMRKDVELMKKQGGV